jgi:NADPH2:quinone reductase
LTCMEAAATAKAGHYSLYGSSAHKQVYIYGALDRSPTELTRNYGMAWGVGGWLLIPFMQKVGPEGMDRIRRRIVNGLRTTFASSYSRQVSLVGALQVDAIADYGRAATGAKYLINPNQ